MANRSGVSFPTAGNTVAGLLDGILQAQLRSRQFQQEDAAEARRNRTISLQERTQEESQRRLREQFEAEREAQERGEAFREKQFQFNRERAIAEPEESRLFEEFKENLKRVTQGQRIEQTGEQARETKRVPTTRSVKPEIEKTITEQEAESAKATGSFAKNIRNSGSIPGDPNLTPAELDFRFGEDFLNTAVAQASAKDLHVADVVKDSMATHWATAVIDPAIEGDYIDSLDPANVERDDLDPLSPDVRLKITKNTKQPVVTANDVRRIQPDFINIPEAGTLNLEELAFVFVSNNATEQEFRDFVKEVLIDRISPTTEQRGQDFEANVQPGVVSPTTGGTGLGSFK